MRSARTDSHLPTLASFLCRGRPRPIRNHVWFCIQLRALPGCALGKGWYNAPFLAVFPHRLELWERAEKAPPGREDDCPDCSERVNKNGHPPQWSCQGAGVGLRQIQRSIACGSHGCTVTLGGSYRRNSVLDPTQPAFNGQALAASPSSHARFQALQFYKAFQEEKCVPSISFS